MVVRQKSGLSLVELVVAVAIIATLAALALPALAQARESGRRASCQNNLKQLGMALLSYSNESAGALFPPTQEWHLNATPTISWVRLPLLYPEYIAELNSTLCPSDSRIPEFAYFGNRDYAEFIRSRQDAGASRLCIDALLSIGVSYAYIPHAVRTSSQLTDVLFSRSLMALNFSQRGDAVYVAAADFLRQGCPRKVFASFGSLGEADIPGDPDWQVGFGHLDDDGSRLPEGYHRLRQGIERFLITDVHSGQAQATASSEVPVLLDSWAENVPVLGGVARFNHVPSGSNVLYLDGHVDFVALGSRFPVANSPDGTFGQDLSKAMAAVSGVD